MQREKAGEGKGSRGEAMHERGVAATRRGERGGGGGDAKGKQRTTATSVLGLRQG